MCPDKTLDHMILERHIIRFLGGAEARSARACDARTRHMVEFDAACDLTQPVPPHKRWSRAPAPLPLSKMKQYDDKKSKTDQSVCGTETPGGLVGVISSRCADKTWGIGLIDQ